MGHFQVPSDRKLYNPESGLREWPKIEAGHRFYTTGNSGEEKIGIAVGSAVQLTLVIDKWKHFAKLESTNLGAVVPGIVSGAREARVTVRIEAKAAGTATVFAKDDSGDVIASLKVAAGKFEKHDHMQVDLIADVCSGNDALKILALQRMLHDNDESIFDQHGLSNNHVDYGDMACGIVAKYRGSDIFGSMTKAHYERPYHEPLAGRALTRSHVRYRPDRLVNLMSSIGKMLRAGKPVRVGVLDHPAGMTPVNGKLITHQAGGHTVLIVGANQTNTQFMYIDPWPGGSKMRYTGGITGNKFPAECGFLGLFEAEYDPSRSYDPKRRPNVLVQSKHTEGTFDRAGGDFLEVTAGPFVL